MREPFFKIEPMTIDHVDPCFAIVRMVLPSIDLARWRHFVRATLAAREDRRGMITVRWNNRRFPCGLAGYHCVSDIELRRIMVVRPLAAIDPLHTTPLLAGLADRLAMTARALDCEAIRIVTPGPDLPALAFSGSTRAMRSAGEHTFLL